MATMDKVDYGRRRILHGRHIGQHRDMRTDDHELIRGLTLIEFIYKPFVAFSSRAPDAPPPTLSVSSRTMTLIGISAFG